MGLVSTAVKIKVLAARFGNSCLAAGIPTWHVEVPSGPGLGLQCQRASHVSSLVSEWLGSDELKADSVLLSCYSSFVLSYMPV